MATPPPPPPPPPRVPPTESEISRGLYKSLHLVSLFLRQNGAFKLQKVSFLASLLVFNIADSIERNSGFQETDQVLISNAAKNRLVHRLFVLKDLVKIVWIRSVNVTDEKKLIQYLCIVLGLGQHVMYIVPIYF